MPRLFVARYDPGIDYEHNPFQDPKLKHHTVDLLAISGSERESVVLFESDDITARLIASLECIVTPAPAGRYNDDGSESVIVVRADDTYVIEDDAR